MVGELYLNNAFWRKCQKRTEGDLGSTTVTSIPKGTQQKWLQVLEKSDPPVGAQGGRGTGAPSGGQQQLSFCVTPHTLNRPQSKDNGAAPWTTHYSSLQGSLRFILT